MSPDRKPTKPLDIYVRVSRVGGRSGESFISPEVQEERCRAMATAKGHKVGQVFTDLDQSGGKMERPEFEKAMERIRNGASGGMIVQKLDRFARNTRGLLTTVDEMEQHGAAFVCVEPNIDTADPAYGRFLLTLFAGLAELELARISGAWAVAHERHIARGVPTGRAPAGYRKDENGRLVVVPEHAEAVVEAFKRRAAGGTWAQLRDLLNERGVPTATGNAWIERTASRLLANRTLLGEVRFGRMVNKDAHEPLPGLTPALFRKVQATREEPAPRTRKEPALLAGILRCKTCGGRLTQDANRRNGDKPYRFYRCRSEHHKDRPTIGAANIEEYLITKALEHAGTVWGTSKLGDNEAYAEAQAALAEAQAELAEVEEMIGTRLPADSKQALAVVAAQERLEAAAEGGQIAKWFIPGPNDPEFSASILDEDTVDPVTGEIIPAGTVTPGWTDEDFAEAGIANTRMVFDRMPVEKRRQALASLIERATVRVGQGTVEERVEVEWRA